MFKKVLIAEDFGSISKMLQDLLTELGVQVVDFAQYCDDAYLKLKSATLKQDRYDLLIADLSFKADHRTQVYKTGEELIAAVHKENPDLKIIVFSMEEKLQRVRTLIEQYGVKSYVCKGRNGVSELTQAIRSTANDEQYLSPQIACAFNENQNLEIEDYDIELMRHLSLGYSNKEISQQFEITKVGPSSLSSIEKRLNRLRIQFKANNATHLVAIVKDIGLI
ncbi:DNA-binding response regulator [Leeuwenhoekiella sp. A16]|uniref:DNA-binding response regulator n=1 Tax=unclassified Leeuwenhoekiella TaxID=2615029 RepID=UPI003A80BA95